MTDRDIRSIHGDIAGPGFVIRSIKVGVPVKPILLTIVPGVLGKIHQLGTGQVGGEFIHIQIDLPCLLDQPLLEISHRKCRPIGLVVE